MSAPVEASAHAATSNSSLLARLTTETDQAIADCLCTARAQAVGLRESAEREAEQALRELRESAGRAHHDERAKVRARAEQRVRGSLLDARATVIARVITAAIAQADTLSVHPGLPDMLHTDIARGLRYLPEGRVVIRCPPGIASAVRAAVAPMNAMCITVEEDADMAFGVILQSEDGRMEVNATVARTIARQRARLDIRIAHLMSELAA